jgi:hypothetical protein
MSGTMSEWQFLRDFRPMPQKASAWVDNEIVRVAIDPERKLKLKRKPRAKVTKKR